jgi:hypothetical protein
VRILDHSPRWSCWSTSNGTVCGATGVQRQAAEHLGGAGRRGCHRHRRLRLPEPRAGLQRAHRRRPSDGGRSGRGSLSGMEFSNAYGLGRRSRRSPSRCSTTGPPSTRRRQRDRRGGLVQRAQRDREDTADRSRCSPASTGPTRRSARGCAPRNPTSSCSFDRQGIDPVHAALSRDAAARRHGARHRRAAPGRRQLRHVGTRPLRRRRCRHARTDLRRLHGGRQPQRGLGAVFRASGPARAPRRSGARAAGANARRCARAAWAFDARRNAAPTARKPDSRRAGRSVSLRAQLVPRGDALRDSLGRLDALWERLRTGAPAATATEAVRAREAAAHAGPSRWMYRSALAAHRNARHAPPPRTCRTRSGTAAPAAERRARRGVGATPCRAGRSAA